MSANIIITFKIRFIKGKTNGMPSILTPTKTQMTLSYNFDLKDDPTFFDLWCRCPSMLLVPVGETKPYLEFDTPLIQMPTHWLDAYDWTEEYHAHRLELKKRMCAKLKNDLIIQRSAAVKELERITTRIKSLVEYEAALQRDDIARDIRFPFM